MRIEKILSFCRLMVYVLCFIHVACDEKLPPRVVPQGVLQVSAFLADQAFYVSVGGHCIRIYLAVENMYHETLQDTVNIRGQVRIWWKKYPDIVATCYLDNRYIIEPTPITGNLLTLDPGDKCHLELLWPMVADDGRYLLDLMDFSDSPVINDVVRAKPDTFYLKAQLMIFEQTGYVSSQQVETPFTGWKIVEH